MRRQFVGEAISVRPPPVKGCSYSPEHGQLNLDLVGFSWAGLCCSYCACHPVILEEPSVARRT